MKTLKKEEININRVDFNDKLEELRLVNEIIKQVSTAKCDYLDMGCVISIVNQIKDFQEFLELPDLRNNSDIDNLLTRAHLLNKSIDRITP